jgi:hypothetical protein
MTGLNASPVGFGKTFVRAVSLYTDLLGFSSAFNDMDHSGGQPSTHMPGLPIGSIFL